MRSLSLQRRIDALESAPGGVGWVFVFCAVTFLRGWLEGILEESQTLGFRLETVASLEMTFLHGPVFYFVVFALASFLLSLLARAPVERTARAAVAFSPVILVAPLLDALVRSGGHQLHYFNDLPAALSAAVHTFNPAAQLPGVSPGMRVEALVACAAGGLYVRAKRGGVLFPLFGFLAIYLIALAGGALPAIFARLVAGGFPQSTVFSEGGLVFSDSRKYSLLLLHVALVVVAASLLRSKWKKRALLLRALRPLRSIFYLCTTGFGAVLGAVFLRGYYPELERDPFLILAVAGALATVFLIFQTQLLLNDHWDREIDRVTRKTTYVTGGVLAGREATTVGTTLFLLSLAFAGALGYAALLLTMGAHVLGGLYSAPPARLKRFFPLNLFTVALCILLAALLGFSLFAGRHTVGAFPPGVAVFLVVCFTFVAAVKDLPDAEGDRGGGIRTLASLLGERRSRYLMSAAVALAYILAPLLLRSPPLLLLALPCGGASAAAVWKGRESWVFVLLFVAGIALGVFVWQGRVLAPPALAPRAALLGSYLSGVSSVGRGDSDAAIARFREALQILSAERDGKDENILLRQGKVELRDGRHGEALHHLATAARGKGHSEDAAVHAAAAASRLGREGDAVELLSRAIDLRPQSARLRLARGAILVAENPAGAGRDLEYAYRCRLERDVTCSYLGDLGLRLGDTVFARRFYEEALRQDPLSAAARAGLERLGSQESTPQAGE